MMHIPQRPIFLKENRGSRKWSRKGSRRGSKKGAVWDAERGPIGV